MNIQPPTSMVHWPQAWRIVSTRYPPIDLFEDIADPSDWELLIAAEMKTNPRLVDSIGQIDSIPVTRRVSGSGASYVMAPFTHISPDRPGRFHDGTYGAYYAAQSFATAVAETAYHKTQFYRTTSEAPGWFAQMRELVGMIHHQFHDIRNTANFRDCLDPSDYQASQRLAGTLRQQSSSGIVYPSVRDANGECVAAFWPDVVGIPAIGRVLAYHFDGETIDMIRDEQSRKTFQLQT